MQFIVENYHDGESAIPKSLLNEIQGLIIAEPDKLEKYEIKAFNDNLLDELKMKGWTLSIFLSGESSISITAMKENVGLCIQTGNMARFYADLMKLQALYMDSRIESAIFILPQKKCANHIGSNVANFERMTNELTHVFFKVISIPMVIIGFESKENNDG